MSARPILVAAVGLAALFVRGAPAHACGGHGGGGGGAHGVASSGHYHGAAGASLVTGPLPPVQLELDAGVLAPSLAARRFEQGHQGIGPLGPLAGTGHQFGFDQPAVFGASARASIVLGRYFSLGAYGGFGVGANMAGRDANSPVDATVQVASVGGSAAVTYGVGPVRLRLGVDAGVRYYSINILAARFLGCDSNAVTSLAAVVEPRPAVEVALDPARTVSLGLYATMNVLAPTEFGGGLALSFAAPAYDQLTRPAPPPEPDPLPEPDATTWTPRPTAAN